MKRFILIAVMALVPTVSQSAEYTYRNGVRVKLTAEEIAKLDDERAKALANQTPKDDARPLTTKKIKEIFANCSTLACVKTAIENPQD